MSDDVMEYLQALHRNWIHQRSEWYRAAGRIGSVMAEAEPRIEVPSLYIGAENDVILPPSSADGMEDFISDLESTRFWIAVARPASNLKKSIESS